MSVIVKSTETDKTLTLHWESNGIGETVTNHAGVGSTHPTILTVGKVRLEIEGQRPREFEAPHTITLPLKIPYTFTTLTRRATIDCIYSKTAGADDEIRHLVVNDDKGLVYRN